MKYKQKLNIAATTLNKLKLGETKKVIRRNKSWEPET